MTNKKKGFTLLELMIVLGLLSLVLTAGVPRFKAFFSRTAVSSSTRLVVIALQTARYKAVYFNGRVKVCVEDNLLCLKKKEDGVWEEFKSFTMDKGVTLSTNNSPVFSPTGSVAPLCTLKVGNDRYRYKITLSMAGRIKVTES
ncbi:MAG: prepilin-type N-terminal cleavage/methylation domain-containing protein [bacterium]|nr:prepilin-type N-terminal cleavage/methylation domain-containing protein [bacterium]